MATESLALTVDGEALVVEQDSCVIARRDYGRCGSYEQSVLREPAFVADRACTLSTACGAAMLEVSGPRVDALRPPEDQGSLMVCENVRYRYGRLEVEVLPYRWCGSVTGLDSFPRRVTQCPLPPTLPRRPLSVFVNGNSMGTVDFSLESTCE